MSKTKSSVRSIRTRFPGVKLVRRGKRVVAVIPKKLKAAIPPRAKMRQGS